MLKVNNKDTRTYFTPCSSVSIVNSEHIIAGWKIDIFSLVFMKRCHYDFENIHISV